MITKIVLAGLVAASAFRIAVLEVVPFFAPPAIEATE